MQNKLRLAIVAAVAVGMAVPLIALASTGISAQLDSSQIVNPHGGDPNGTGVVKLRVNRVERRVCFKVRYDGLHKVTGSHIHKGDVGEIGRPIITLFEGDKASPVKGCVHDLKKKIVKRLKRKPQLHYVDIDTQKYPDGAIRGQLTK